MNPLIVLPARNEETNIGSLLRQISQLYPDLPILVVDDASEDATRRIVSSFPGISLISLPFWIGYGGALQTAYKYALQKGYEGVVQLDADGQHSPASIADLCSALQNADLVVGSRFSGSNPAYRMSRTRRFGCRLLSWTAKLLTGMTITDPTSGFQALSRRALEVASQDHYPLDYPDIDVLILMHRFRLRVKEIPVTMYPSVEPGGMHEGLQVWYYAVKMMLSILVMMLRRV